MKTKILIVLISVLVALGALELAVRSFWKPSAVKSDFVRDDYGWLQRGVRLDRFGYRDREFDLEKKQGVYRIYVLGDSYSYGWYLDDPQANYPKILEKNLKTRYGEAKVEVINAARPGYNFEGEVNRYRNEGLMFDADMVIVGINLFDLVDSSFSFQKAKENVLNKLLLYRLISGNLERSETARKTNKVLTDSYKEGSKQLERAEEQFRALKELTDAVGADLVIVLFPQYDPANPNEDYRHKDAHQQVAKLAEKLSVPIVDLLENYTNYPDKTELVLDPIDPHPTALAHKIAAETIVSTLDFDELLKSQQNRIVKSSQVERGSQLEDFLSVIRIEGEDWIYFDHRMGNSEQKIFIPDVSDRKTDYFEDSIKTVKSFTHDGWPGARIEYNVPYEGNKVIMPRTIYGYRVVGVNQVKGFVSASSKEFSLGELRISETEDGIEIEIESDKEFDLLKLQLDVAVHQLEIDEGKVVRTTATAILEVDIQEGSDRATIETNSTIGSFPRYVASGEKTGYVWVDNEIREAKFVEADNGVEVVLGEQVEKSATVRLPVSVEVEVGAENRPTVVYI